MIQLFNCFEQHKVSLWVILAIYPHFFVPLFKHLVWNRLSSATATVVAPVVTYKGQSLLVLSATLIQWYNYVVIYFWLTYFILSIVGLKTISTEFFAITANKVSLFFLFDQNLFLWFECFIILNNMKSLYESYWPYLYIIYHLFFQTSDLKQTSAATSKIVALVVSGKGKSSYLFCCIVKLIQFCCYIFLINLFILSIICSNPISTDFFISQQRR